VRIRIAGIGAIFVYASFSEVIPMSPVLALVVGLGVTSAAYYRWHRLEMR
jgi:hypothetical protein